ncbi:MAG: metal-sensitive transcriptional regulator [Gemmatimonadota bacterium]|nr:metal-sensitive transcriptional regulator [Gemmatimonadota bacterium]
MTGSITSPHAMDIPTGVREDLGRRLARIRGQVEGIGRMVEEERYCPEILQQCAAVHSALRSAEKELLASHLERCATRAIAEGGDAADDVRREIVELFQRFVR